MAAGSCARHFVPLLLFLVSSAAQAGDKVVTATNYQFTPVETRILVGQKVTWTNAGGMHNVFSNDGLFRTQISTDSWQFSFTFKTPGTFSYVCQQHSGGGGYGGYGGFNMTGFVSVRSSNAPPQLSIVPN